MKNIMGRISGIIRSENRKLKRGEIGIEAYREVRRSLKLAQKIIFEEIVTCDRCLSFVGIDELIRQGAITSTDADAEEALGHTGICLIDRDERNSLKYVCSCDYCSFGAKDDGEEEL